MTTVIHEDHNGGKTFDISEARGLPPGHAYQIGSHSATEPVFIEFQNGPVNENGINGATNEALLAVLIERTEILSESFPCIENVYALDGMRFALSALESRSQDRIARGVEVYNKA